MSVPFFDEKEGLTRLKLGLERAGLDAKFFSWPPGGDPKRPPYRGLKPLEAEDAGIFFGREASTIEALDRLRGLKDATPGFNLASYENGAMGRISATGSLGSLQFCTVCWNEAPPFSPENSRRIALRL
jgi:hypothetical protein